MGKVLQIIVVCLFCLYHVGVLGRLGAPFVFVFFRSTDQHAMQMTTVHNLEEEQVKALTSGIGVSYTACAATAGTTFVIG